MSISRREFVGMTGLAAATALSGDMEGAGIGPVKTYRAAVIGRTGRGNYGHGLDLAFQKIPNVTVVAVADEDAAREASNRSAHGRPARVRRLA